MSAWLGGHHGIGLVAADTAVQERTGQRIHPAAQFAEAFQCIDPLVSDGSVVVCQQLHGSSQFFRIKAWVHVENTVTWSPGEEFTGADVGGDHGLFDHTIGNAPWFGMNGHNGSLFIQLEVVIGLVAKYQSIFATPFMTSLCDSLQCLELFQNNCGRVKALALTLLQQIGDFIIDEAALGADGGGKETEISRQAAIGADNQFAAECMARFALYQ